MKTFKEIDVDGAKQALDSGAATFLDIRDPASFASGHVRGALQLADRQALEAFIAEQDRSKRLIIYCYHGNSSRDAAAFFSQQGFSEVYSMVGGFEHWRVNYDEDIE
ncbi:MAG: thiosulfate sulfurtransferase GlpE [Deltaproteobacteria bacterium]|nr:thiosulfate sulfurtransferase GlpE [Deltaproteobacteria bacterium]